MAMTGGTARLVHTGYANGNTSAPIKVYVYYKTTQDVNANKSTIYCGLYVDSTWDIGPWTDWTNDGSMSYVGTTANSFDGSIPMFYGVRWIAENQSFTVDHNDDGTGTATIYWRWDVNSPWGKVERPYGSFSINLPTIPRASSMSTNTTAPRMGENLVISIGRHSTSFTHTLRYEFNGASGTIATGVGDSYTWAVPDLAGSCNNATSGTLKLYCTTYNGSTKVGEVSSSMTLTVQRATVPSFPDGNVIIGTSNRISTPRNSGNFSFTIQYKFPESASPIDIGGKATGGYVWWTPYSLASLIPSATSGTGKLICTTYNGDAVVGTETITFTAVVPENEDTRPSFKEEGLALSPVSSLPAPFNSMFIMGKTKLKAAFTASSLYSSIKSYTLTVGSISASGNPCTTADYLSSNGEVVVKGTVTDARGFSTTVSKTITVIPYDTPKVTPATGQNIVICERCLPDGTPDPSGTSLLIKAGRKYSPVVSEGTQCNFCSLRYRIKLTTASSYGAWVEIITKNSTSGDEATYIGAEVVALGTASYDVQISAADDMGSDTIIHFVIPTDDVAFHLKAGGKAAGFGKYAEADDLLDVAWNIRGAKDLTVGGNVYAFHIAAIDDYDGYDFNELLYQTGYYLGSSAPSTSGCSNYPENVTGMLEVISCIKTNPTTGNKWGFAYQTYRTHTGTIYTRSYLTGNGFTAWKKVQFV